MTQIQKQTIDKMTPEQLKKQYSVTRDKDIQQYLLQQIKAKDKRGVMVEYSEVDYEDMI